MERTENPEPGGAARSFTIRKAEPGDASSFLAMWRGVVAEERFVRTETVRRGALYYRRAFRRSWTREQANIVAVHRDRVVGHLALAREDDPAVRHVASMGMSVDRQWRGIGIGDALMSAGIAWAKEMRVEKLALSVYPDNVAARNLYGKFGFREEGRLSGHSKKRTGYRDEILMGLWLIDQPRSVSDDTRSSSNSDR